MNIRLVDYIWIDGATPIQKMRSKTKVINHAGLPPNWGFDGSSTYQAESNDSDIDLVPKKIVVDPLRIHNTNIYYEHTIALCETYKNGVPHESNKRAELVELVKKTEKHNIKIGFEQEYTLMENNAPLGFPTNGYPKPQGPYYCGVGADEVYGRSIVEKHIKACLHSKLMLFGTNAEVMPGQWEFQIGYRGILTDSDNIVDVCDDLWIARYLLYRIAEKQGISATLDPKPVVGDWNGAGLHTNFSTSDMRDPNTGMQAINGAIARLEERHLDHMKVYGSDNEKRLTGSHETCHVNNFKSGVADRSASIRIPRTVYDKGYGYLEDRRPAANADPYEIASRLIKTIIIGD